MKEDVDALLETIREACSPKAWSCDELAGTMISSAATTTGILL